MLYELKIGWRYLTSNLVQTGLLVLGVAVGVFVFVFMSALIGGLAVYLINQTVGDIAHLTIVEPELAPATLYAETDGTLIVSQNSTGREATVRNVPEVIATLAQYGSVTAISPQISGNGLVTRGAIVKPVGVIGVEPDKVSALADIEGRLTAGRPDLPIGGVLIGQNLADILGVSVGQGLRLRSDRGVDMILSIVGIYRFGVDGLDERTIYVNIKTARGLFDMRDGVSQIAVRIEDLWAAPDFARQLEKATGLNVTAWTETNEQLLAGLDAQGRSGDIIKGFALVTIVIGVASALLLSTYRRRSEIGIMRAMGATRGFVVMVFVAQGALIGILGGLSGAGLGWIALSPFPPASEIEPGGFPIDIAQGGFGLAIALTFLGALVASILPARAAAKVDPVTVISQ